MWGNEVRVEVYLGAVVNDHFFFKKIVDHLGNCRSRFLNPFLSIEHTPNGHRCGKVNLCRFEVIDSREVPFKQWF